MQVYYMAYDGREFYEFKTYRECMDFVSSQKGFCRYKKISVEDERKAFIDSVYNKSKIYIVIHNNEVKQFGNWADCKVYVDAHPGVIYKSFKEMEDVQNFINMNVKKEINLNEPGLLICYTDGSYSNLNQGVFGAGFVAVKNGQVKKKWVGSSTDKNNGHQTGGEFMAALEAIKYAISIKEPRVVIIYDYTGVENFANGTWAPKKEGPKKYHDEIVELKKKINIDFVHVKSHKTKDRTLHNDFNDMADELAKSGIN